MRIHGTSPEGPAKLIETHTDKHTAQLGNTPRPANLNLSALIPNGGIFLKFIDPPYSPLSPPFSPLKNSSTHFFLA
ncbi:hypothetical protein RRG08_013558 [Elysia crispata]|uniref:Uncharacterized protein n=1 Tax=Elysia crispata TaxID=231223 RepID=A0AAE0Y168_9GAST|nr:hypothetical protein RRG08_013558 [Elysia crispata]